MIRPTEQKPKSRNGLGAGRRMKTWQQVSAWLRPRLDRAGRVGCELRSVLPHGECWGPIDLAHSKKRYKMEGDDVYEVIRICRKSHEMIERLPHSEMERIVKKAIRKAGGIIKPL
jgi:hypothetical protein